MTSRNRDRQRQAFAAALALVAMPAFAQETVSLQVPRGAAGADEALATGDASFAIPDLPLPEPKQPGSPGLLDIRVSLVVLGDHTFFWQDQESVGQVGTQPNEWELRAARLSFLGSIGGSYRVGFQLSGEYKGFDGDPETTWQMTDISLTFPMGTRTKLILGKTKQTFAYEMVGDAAPRAAMERVLSPFFQSRNAARLPWASTMMPGTSRTPTAAGGTPARE